jgi:hypothetical protein
MEKAQRFMLRLLDAPLARRPRLHKQFVGLANGSRGATARGLQAKVLHPDVVEYVFRRFEEQLARLMSRQSCETSAVRRRAELVERQIRNCTEALASMGLSGALRGQLTSLETQDSELTEKLASAEPRAVRLQLRDTRRFVEARLKNLQSMLVPGEGSGSNVCPFALSDWLRHESTPRKLHAKPSIAPNLRTRVRFPSPAPDSKELTPLPHFPYFPIGVFLALKTLVGRAARDFPGIAVIAAELWLIC